MQVFLSYRRSDTRDFSARLADRLRASPDVSDVFLDVTKIEPGERFPQRLTDALRSSDVVLIAIGKNWAGGSLSNAPGGAEEGVSRPRIFSPDDFVRREVEQSLLMNKRIIPILVDDAPPLVADYLPDEIKDLASINAVFARHASFDHDVGVILDAIIAEAPEGWFRRLMNRNPSLGIISRVAGALTSGLLLLLILAVIHNVATGGEPLERNLGGSGALVALVAIAIVLVGSAAFWRLTKSRKEREL